MQKNIDIDNEEYNHKHVLRKILNTTFGESIGDSFNSGDTWDKNYTVNISELENQNENYSLNTSFMGNGTVLDGLKRIWKYQLIFIITLIMK